MQHCRRRRCERHCHTALVAAMVAAMVLTTGLVGGVEACADNSRLQPGEYVEPNLLCFRRVDAVDQCLSVFGYKCNVDRSNMTAGVPTNAEWNNIVAPATVLMPAEWLERNSLNFTLHVLWECGPHMSYGPSAAALAGRTLRWILDSGLAKRMWLLCGSPTVEPSGLTTPSLCVDRLDYRILSAQLMDRPLSDDDLIAALAVSECA